jgi:hypothetical protein
VKQAALRKYRVERLGRGEEECEKHPDVGNIRKRRKLGPDPLVKSNQAATYQEKHQENREQERDQGRRDENESSVLGTNAQPAQQCHRQKEHW